ncbi:MAG: AAA family ATPase, partial [Deltaproteobacteria bacterium]|nr:AAA family ATPase [Deltaproteobacteria bacterium]
MKDLPIGMASFEEIRLNGNVYADKTEFLRNLLKSRKPYFLSRPRRFGKSLLVSTLEAILRGRRELFQGLWIDSSDYDWT